MSTRRLPPVPTAALGVLSIVAFGSWLYGYGVLIEPIGADTGWSETVLGGTFGAGMLASGLLGTGVGHALDTWGSRRTFFVVGAAAAAAMAVTSVAGSSFVFAIAGTVAGGLVGAGGYYGATAAVMARVVPEHRAHGITVLTLVGALASPIFLPTIGALLGVLDWREVMRLLAATVVVSFAAAALLVPDVRPQEERRPPFRAAVRAALDRPARRDVVLAVLGGGVTASVVVVQQVPTMVAAGMGLALASQVAGARGLLQLAGRLPLAPIVVRFGSRRVLRASYGLLVVGSLLLIGAGDLPQAIAFAVIAGVGLGASTTAEAILAAEVFDGPSVATHLGVVGLARGVGAAVGPTVAGVLVDATGGRSAALLLASAAALASVAALRARPTTTGVGEPAVP